MTLLGGIFTSSLISEKAVAILASVITAAVVVYAVLWAAENCRSLSLC